MGKDKRSWRKLVKKLRRQRQRQRQTQVRISESIAESDVNEEGDSDLQNEFVNSYFFVSEAEWEERENESILANAMKKAEEDRLAEIEEAKQKKIRAEWEIKEALQRKEKEEKERLEKLLKETQEAEFNEFLSFLSGDIETPPTKYLMPEIQPDVEEICHYFSRTAACRFYGQCTKFHPRPTLSTAILIPNFFTHIKLEQCFRDEYDYDIGLEYEDAELYSEFLQFYNDVMPELRKFGSVIQFKVCCNLQPHLRGNVYIQYESIKESIEAFRKFNGRFYDGKQLSLQFIKIDSWRSAICGSFLRKACIKGRTCNYLHVFRNPTKEFVKADRDWKELYRPVPVESSTFNANKSLPKSSVPFVSTTVYTDEKTPSESVPSCSRKDHESRNSRIRKSSHHEKVPVLTSEKSGKDLEKLRDGLTSSKHKKRSRTPKKKKHKKEKKRHKKEKRKRKKKSSI